jgi:hypothetical protein
MEVGYMPGKKKIFSRRQVGIILELYLEGVVFSSRTENYYYLIVVMTIS